MRRAPLPGSRAAGAGAPDPAAGAVPAPCSARPAARLAGGQTDAGRDPGPARRAGPLATKPPRSGSGRPGRGRLVRRRRPGAELGAAPGCGGRLGGSCAALAVSASGGSRDARALPPAVPALASRGSERSQDRLRGDRPAAHAAVALHWLRLDQLWPWQRLEQVPQVAFQPSICCFLLPQGSSQLRPSLSPAAPAKASHPKGTRVGSKLAALENLPPPTSSLPSCF